MPWVCDGWKTRRMARGGGGYGGSSWSSGALTPLRLHIPRRSPTLLMIEAAKLPILLCGAPVRSPNIGVRCSSKRLEDTQSNENYLNKVSVYSAFFIYTVYGSSRYVDPSHTLKLPSYYLWPGKIGKCANSGMAYLFYPHEISDVFAFDTIFSWLQSNLQLKVLLMSHEPYRYYAWLIQARWAMDSRQK